MWNLTIEGKTYESKKLQDLLLLLALELDCGEIETRKEICLVKLPANLSLVLH